MIKKIIKSIPGFNVINNIRKKYKMYKEFDYDKAFFMSNYISSSSTVAKIEYDVILDIHSIEKGMCSKCVRPFGVEKVKKIMRLIKEYETLTSKKSFAYNLANSCLYEYLKFYEANDWCNREEYNMVKDFMNMQREYDYIKVGGHDIYYDEFALDSKIDYGKFLDSRHSVRNFSDKPLSCDDIKKAIDMAIKTPSACNRQMCKVYYIKNEINKKFIEKYAQGLSNFDLDNVNYFVVTFDVNSNYFIGERNQGWFNAGLFSMNFVNALHSLGIGSCFIQFGNSFKEEMLLKEKLSLGEGERIAVILTAGYYAATSKIPYSTRKSIDDIYFER